LSSLPIPQSVLIPHQLLDRRASARKGRVSVIEKKEKEKREKTLAHDERSIDAFG
jgi:hypothetical protein